MNVLVAFVIFFGVFATTHVQVEGTTRVAAVDPKTPAQMIGLHANDRVVAVNGRPTPTFDDVSQDIQASKGHAISVTVLRNGKRVVLGPAKTIQSQGRWILGFKPATVDRKISYSFGASVRHAADYCWLTVTGTVKAVSGIFHAKQRAQISGPVGIVRASHQALQAGTSYYLEILGFVSMSLALLNLLPFLPLDGGHILFSVIEAVRRRALAREVYERVSFVGFSLIILIWIIAFSNDLSSKHPG